MCQALSPADHRQFFVNKKLGPRFGIEPDDCCSIPAVVEAARFDQEEISISLMEIMLTICQSHDGSCLAEVPGILEEAAVQAAIRGRLRVVERLIDYVKSEDLILSAAIRSGNQDLVNFLFRRNRVHNPPARYLWQSDLSKTPLFANKYPLESIYGQGDTTPLAEATRTRNNQMIHLLEMEDCGTFESLKEHGRLKPMLSARALRHGQEEAASLLIEEGARCEDGSALSVALKKRCPKIVTAILASDILGGVRSSMNAALQWAELSILESLLYVMPDMRVDVTSDEVLVRFCLHCMETQSFELFRLFMESTSTNAISMGLEGCLAMAITQSHHQMALYLLQKGANPSNPRVLAAAIPNRPEMLSLLFENDPQYRQEVRAPRKCVGANLLKFLMSEDKDNGESHTLNQLLAIGAVNLIVPEEVKPPGERHGPRLTPLGLAILGVPGHCDTNVAAIKKFLKAGADPNATAKLEKYPHRCITALMVALETGREDIVTLMIDEGADVNLQPQLSLRRTPLQYAAELGNVDMVRLLLHRGADVNSPASFQGGGTALQLAAISGNCNIAAELLEQGASLEISPSKIDGRWPLEGAAEHGRLDMIQFLWNARELSPRRVGFEKRQCLRAMDFARENGHIGCQGLISELSGLSVEMLDTEDYGVPWLAY